MNTKYRNSFCLGMSLVLVALAIGIFLESDIGFLFAGAGIIIIGITFLAYINRNNQKDDK